MIDDRKLLCAFIYSAYESGYCGLKLDPQTRDKHMELYREYVQTGRFYPEEEISETQGKMMGHINSKGIRDYVYNGHFDIVVKRIEEESGQSFEDFMRSGREMALYPALRCPINFYKVVKIDGDNIEGRNIFIPHTQRLIILEGLERPNLGDIVSGHWNYFLEIVNELGELDKYKSISKAHIERSLGRKL